MTDSGLFDPHMPCGKGRCRDNVRPGHANLHLTVGKVYVFYDIDERINSAVVEDDRGYRRLVRYDRFEVLE